MAYLNKVALIGNLGREPEVRVMQDGSKFASVSLATTKKFTDRNNQAREQTTWHNLVFSGNIVDVLQFCHSGDMIYVDGEYVSRQYTNKDNVQVTVFEVRVQNLQMLFSRPQRTAPQPTMQSAPQLYLSTAQQLQAQQMPRPMPQPIYMPQRPAPQPTPQPAAFPTTHTEYVQQLRGNIAAVAAQQQNNSDYTDNTDDLPL